MIMLWVDMEFFLVMVFFHRAVSDFHTSYTNRALPIGWVVSLAQSGVAVHVDVASFPGSSLAAWVQYSHCDVIG